MERRYAAALAHAADTPISAARQRLRALREAGLVPGNATEPQSKHIARVILALAGDCAKAGVERVNALRLARLATGGDLPPTAEALLARLVEVLPRGPVLGDLDLDGGQLHVGEAHIVLEALTLSGKRAANLYGARPAGIAPTVTIPISTIRRIAEAIA